MLCWTVIRSRKWLKVKVHQEEEFVMGGFTASAGARKALTAAKTSDLSAKSGLVSPDRRSAPTKQVAIDALEAGRNASNAVGFESDSPQNPPQSAIEADRERFAISEKALN